VTAIEERIRAIDWTEAARNLDAEGNSVVRELLSPKECGDLAGLYSKQDRFRSRVIMAKHGFGRGEYQYFGYPLPELVAELRSAVYPRLAPVANDWNGVLGVETRFPDDHAEFLKRCHKAGQTRPTPLLLQYEPGDYNCLHQDLYGEQVFPLQLAILLSEPGKDFTGGEFVMTEQRPRMQSRPMVVPLGQGDGVIFAVHHRPVAGTQGVYRVNLRHGVSSIRSGHRHTLGITFTMQSDAEMEHTRARLLWLSRKYGGLRPPTGTERSAEPRGGGRSAKALPAVHDGGAHRDRPQGFRLAALPRRKRLERVRALLERPHPARPGGHGP
jgi:hypothetical protein